MAAPLALASLWRARSNSSTSRSSPMQPFWPTAVGLLEASPRFLCLWRVCASRSVACTGWDPPPFYYYSHGDITNQLVLLLTLPLSLSLSLSCSPLTPLQLSKLNPLLSLARFGQICCYIMYTLFTDLFGVGCRRGWVWYTAVLTIPWIC